MFRGSDAVRRGLLTEHQLRSKAWVRLRHDVYADGRLPRDHALACRAVALRLPAGAVIAGPSAAFLHGIRHAAAFGDEVHVIAPAPLRVPPQKGVRVHVTDLHPRHAVTDPVPHTAPTRTAYDVAAWLPPPQALAILDTLLNRRLIDTTQLSALVRQRQGRSGNRRAEQTIALADGQAQYPMESQLRMRLVTAGLPRPVLRHPVVTPAGPVIHAYMAWPTYRVAVEYHDFRLDSLAQAGWVALHVTAKQVKEDFPTVLRQIRLALTKRGW